MMPAIKSFEDLITIVLAALAFVSFIAIALWATFFADKKDDKEENDK